MNGLLVTPDRFTGCVEDFGYDYLAFSNLKLGTHGPYEGEMGKRELAVVVLGGSCSVESSRGEWREIGARANVFDGKPFTLYLPPNTYFRISAETACDLALCYAKAEEDHEGRLVTPEDVEVEIRGGGNATRQIHKMIRPEFPAHRLMVVEVYTPAGNWSSYPPPQARCAQPAARGRSRRDLLLPNSAPGRLCDTEGVYGRPAD